MLLAAAEPLGDAALLWRAAERVSVEPGALTPASEAGLLEVDDQVRFHHPLVRAAVYRAATPEEGIALIVPSPRRAILTRPPTGGRGIGRSPRPNLTRPWPLIWNAPPSEPYAAAGLRPLQPCSTERAC